MTHAGAGGSHHGLKKMTQVWRRRLTDHLQGEGVIIVFIMCFFNLSALLFREACWAWWCPITERAVMCAVQRANVFERLGRGREKVYLTPEAARKSVFDRLRGAAL